MAVKCKLSASTTTLYLFCFLITINVFVDGVRVQQKRIKGIKGEWGIPFNKFTVTKQKRKLPQNSDYHSMRNKCVLNENPNVRCECGSVTSVF